MHFLPGVDAEFTPCKNYLPALPTPERYGQARRLHYRKDVRLPFPPVPLDLADQGTP